MHLYFIRHGEDQNSTPGILTDTDPSLTDRGRSQARECAKKIKAETNAEPLLIVCSPKKRTLETAYCVADYLGIDHNEVVSDDRLTERDFAGFTGKPASEIFELDESTLAEGGMESYKSLSRRIKQAYDDANSKLANRHVLFVSHSGNLRPLLQAAKNLSVDPKMPVPALAEDSFIRI